MTAQNVVDMLADNGRDRRRSGLGHLTGHGAQRARTSSRCCSNMASTPPRTISGPRWPRSWARSTLICRTSAAAGPGQDAAGGHGAALRRLSGDDGCADGLHVALTDPLNPAVAGGFAFRTGPTIWFPWWPGGAGAGVDRQALRHRHAEHRGNFQPARVCRPVPRTRSRWRRRQTRRPS